MDCKELDFEEDVKDKRWAWKKRSIQSRKMIIEN